MANNVDPDQMPHSAVSALDLHCLQRLSVPILRVIMIFILSEFNLSKSLLFTLWNCRPRWLSWMRRRLETESRGFNPRRGRQYSFVEIFSTVILYLPLIQEGQLSVSGERMCTILVNRLEEYACPVHVWLGKLNALDMTPMSSAVSLPKTST